MSAVRSLTGVNQTSFGQQLVKNDPHQFHWQSADRLQEYLTFRLTYVSQLDILPAVPARDIEP